MTSVQHSHQTVSELTVFDHIRSLRRTAFSIFGVVVLAASGVHYFKDPILTFLLAPLGTTAPELQFLSPLDPLYFILKVDFTLGLLIALPIIVLLVWQFISPAVERRGFLTPLLIILSSCILSFVAATYAYKLLIPLILNYMSGLVVPGTALSFTANGYLDFFLSTTALLILVFQIPLVIVGLTYAGVVNPNQVARNRPYIYLGIIVATAFITPTTDLISLALITLPALAVVELGTLVSRFVRVRGTTRAPRPSLLPTLLGVAIVLVAVVVLSVILFVDTPITLFSTTRSL